MTAMNAPSCVEPRVAPQVLAARSHSILIFFMGMGSLRARCFFQRIFGNTRPAPTAQWGRLGRPGSPVKTRASQLAIRAPRDCLIQAGALADLEKTRIVLERVEAGVAPDPAYPYVHIIKAPLQPLEANINASEPDVQQGKQVGPHISLLGDFVQLAERFLGLLRMP